MDLPAIVLLVNLLELVSGDVYVCDPVVVRGESAPGVARVEMLDEGDEMLEDEDERRLELGLGHLHLLHPGQTRLVENVLIVLVDLRGGRNDYETNGDASNAGPYRSFARSLARTILSYACSAMQATLARSGLFERSFVRSLAYELTPELMG